MPQCIAISHSITPQEIRRAPFTRVACRPPFARTLIEVIDQPPGLVPIAVYVEELSRAQWPENPPREAAVFFSFSAWAILDGNLLGTHALLAPFDADGRLLEDTGVVYTGDERELREIKGFWQHMQNAYITAVFVCALTHAANVHMEEQPLPRPMRRRLARLSEPLGATRVRFLFLRPFGTAPGSAPARGHRPTPLHLVRGYFARYTEDRKLFGKYVGTFWIPAHARGRAEFGQIDKRYIIATVG